MNTNCNQCNKCMYNSMLLMSSVSGEDAPYVCQMCCGSTTVTPKIEVADFEVVSSSINLVAAAC